MRGRGRVSLTTHLTPPLTHFVSTENASSVAGLSLSLSLFLQHHTACGRKTQHRRERCGPFFSRAHSPPKKCR